MSSNQSQTTDELLEVIKKQEEELAQKDALIKELQKKQVEDGYFTYRPNPLSSAASTYTRLDNSAVKDRRYESCWTASIWSLKLGLQLNNRQLSTITSSSSSSFSSSSSSSSSSSATVSYFGASQSSALDFSNFMSDWREMLKEFRTTCLCIGTEADGPYLKSSKDADNNSLSAAETALTGLFASHVSTFLGLKRAGSGLRWVPEAPPPWDRKGRMDGLLVLKTAQTNYHMPILFAEFMVENGSSVVSKRAQAFALATKTLSSGTKAVLGCILRWPRTPWDPANPLVQYELRLYCRPSIGPPSGLFKVADILLDKGKFDIYDDESEDAGIAKFAKLLACSDLLTKWVLEDIDAKHRPFVFPRCTVYHSADFGIKAFRTDILTKVQDDTHNIVRSDRRWDFDLAFLPNCEVLVDNDTTVLLRYEWIKGRHIAIHSDQLHCVLKHLKTLHDNGVVHGDIRLSNIVFADQPGNSRLIDFDMAGRAGEDKYPLNFNPTVFDGERHCDAIAQTKLKFEHDLFAMAAVMNLFFPELADQQQQWQQIIGELRSATDQLLQTVIDKLSSVRFALDCNAELKQAFDKTQHIEHSEISRDHHPRMETGSPLETPDTLKRKRVAGVGDYTPIPAHKKTRENNDREKATLESTSPC